MGLLIQFVMGITPVIGALYLGSPSLVAGWVAHMFHSIVFALVFVALVSADPLNRYMDSRVHATLAGAGYGAVLWVVAAVFVMPLWMQSIGLQGPGIPNINVQSLVGHVVFGGVLGAGYKVLLERLH